MTTISQANHNEEADILYTHVWALFFRSQRLLNIAREAKYDDRIEIQQSYPELVTAARKAEKLCRYVDEVTTLIEKYERKPSPRVNDRPTRTPKSRQVTPRKSFS